MEHKGFGGQSSALALASTDECSKANKILESERLTQAKKFICRHHKSSQMANTDNIETSNPCTRIPTLWNRTLSTRLPTLLNRPSSSHDRNSIDGADGSSQYTECQSNHCHENAHSEGRHKADSEYNIECAVRNTN